MVSCVVDAASVVVADLSAAATAVTELVEPTCVSLVEHAVTASSPAITRETRGRFLMLSTVQGDSGRSQKVACAFPASLAETSQEGRQ